MENKQHCVCVVTAIDIWSYVNAFLCDGSDFSQFCWDLVLSISGALIRKLMADADNGYFNIYQTMFFCALKGKVLFKI